MSHTPGLAAIHHVGATVADLDRALAVWEPFLGVEVGARAGYPRLIDGITVELLQTAPPPP